MSKRASGRRVAARDGIEPPNKGFADLSLPCGFRAPGKKQLLSVDL
jgi:hypothetical protein